MKLQKPKGTQDILPADSAKWQYVENVARETFKKYNYGEIRTPMFEHYEVISRSVGDTTDIVTKEMYDFHVGRPSYYTSSRRNSTGCTLLCRKQTLCARGPKTC